MRVICLTGWAGSGKDATASILVKKYGFVQMAFASILKDIASEVYKFPRELADTQEGKQTLWPCGYEKKTIRDLLLLVGNVERERFGSDIYARNLIESIKKLPSSSNVVISDLRYPVELSQLKLFTRENELEFELWRIQRNGQTESSVKDVSETYMESFNPTCILQNPGTTMEELEKVVDEQFKKISMESTEECCIM